MKKFIVTTSIYEPSIATQKFANMKGWTLVVVGDLKTPHESYRNLPCVYLSPEDQEKISKPLSDCIGWNKIMRRNMGFLYAYQQGADIIATVDDDNIPYDGWGENLLVGKEVEIDIWESENGVFDPLSVTNANHLWHRGYPLQLVPTKNNVKYLGKQKRTPLIQADLWDGDPDIDAMCRLANMPCVKFDECLPYGSNQISPFNSQNTFVHRDAIPFYMVLPFVGRMDDIWGGYLLQKEFRNCIVYNKATVYQDRNKQDLIKNLESEIIGYRNTMSLIKNEYELTGDAKIAYEEYKKAFLFI
jgi:hypothetical protein